MSWNQCRIPMIYTQSVQSTSLDRQTTRSLILAISCILENVVEKQDKVDYPYSWSFCRCIPNLLFHAFPLYIDHQLVFANILRGRYTHSVSLIVFIYRIYNYSSCSPECLLHSLIYIDRLIQSNTVIVNSLSIHRIIITRLV